MESWANRLFEMDESLEFITYFNNTQSFSELRRAIESVITDDFIEFNDCVLAINALEIIATIKGESSENFPGFDDITEDDLDRLFSTEITSYLMNLCDDALNILEREEDNAMFEFNDEYESVEEYIDYLNDLRERVI